MCIPAFITLSGEISSGVECSFLDTPGHLLCSEIKALQVLLWKCQLQSEEQGCQDPGFIWGLNCREHAWQASSCMWLPQKCHGMQQHDPFEPWPENLTSLGQHRPLFKPIHSQFKNISEDCSFRDPTDLSALLTPGVGWDGSICNATPVHPHAHVVTLLHTESVSNLSFSFAPEINFSWGTMANDCWNQVSTC